MRVRRLVEMSKSPTVNYSNFNIGIEFSCLLSAGLDFCVAQMKIIHEACTHLIRNEPAGRILRFPIPSPFFHRRTFSYYKIMRNGIYLLSGATDIFVKDSRDFDDLVKKVKAKGKLLVVSHVALKPTTEQRGSSTCAVAYFP